MMDPATLNLILGLRVAAVGLASATAAVIAQVEIPDLSPIGNVGLVGTLIALAVRYTLSQTEAYRKDLARERAWRNYTEKRLEVKAHNEGVLLEHVTRTNIAVINAGVDTTVLPVMPSLRPDPELPDELGSDTQ